MPSSWKAGSHFYPRRWVTNLRPQDVGFSVLASLPGSPNWTELRWISGNWRYYDGTTVEEVSPEWWMPMPGRPPVLMATVEPIK